MTTRSIIAVAAIVALATGGIGFYGGTKYASLRRGTGRFPGAPAGMFAFGRDGAGMMTGAENIANGEILSVDSGSITLKLQNGGTRIILLSDATAISKTASGTPSDLVQGTPLLITGGANQDGSLSAENIQIRPQLQFRMGGGGAQMPMRNQPR